MDRYLDSNRALWDELTPFHEGSRFYDVEGFRAGRITVNEREKREVGPVVGRELLHLQCHFGLDTLSWARLGARVTGVDFSGRAIELARRLAGEVDLPARFIQANVLDLPAELSGRFDVVFTSQGVLCWLPDLAPWAQGIARVLKPGGLFYLMEIHPLLSALEPDPDTGDLTFRQGYFHSVDPTEWAADGSYADPDAPVSNPSFEWTHPLASVVTSLLDAGLRIELLREHRVCCYDPWGCLERTDDGWYRLPAGRPEIPMMYSLRARL